MTDQIRICTEISGDIHREERFGREYLVAPVVAVTEGVLKGEFLPGEEIQNVADIFEDKPLPVNHPRDENGEPVSAQNREIIENQSVGRFWDVEYQDGKLKGNLWVDIKKAKELGGEAEAVLNKLKNNERIDVSTAYWPDVEKKSGIYNGEKYNGVQRNLTPDHLALLPETKGECSWEDGCGAPRINEEGDYIVNEWDFEAYKEARIEVNAQEPTYSGTEEKDWSAIKKTFTAFKSALDMPSDKSWDELTESQEEEIQGHFLDPSDESFTANGYPVVNPISGKLNKNGLESAKGYAPDGSDIEAMADRLWDEHWGEDQAQNIAQKIWSNLKDHIRGEQDMSEREKHIEALKENGVDVDSVNLDELDDEDVEAWAGAYQVNESEDPEEPEEPETNESEDDEKFEELESEIKELKEKLEAQEADEREEMYEKITANSDWTEDELDDLDMDKVEKLAGSISPKVNMEGKAQPKTYDEDDEVPEREPVIANKSELEGE